jgi:sugar lactone lactonase YvrE
MKPISKFAFAASLLLAACSKSPVTEEQSTTASNEVAAKPKAANQEQDINFNQQNLFPEGVVYDKFNGRFYVSSTTRGDIGIVTTGGSYTSFITDPALIGTAGLEIDEARKLLYVSNSTDGSVGIYNINTGQRVAFIDLKPLLPGAPVFINDIALDPQGNAYVTNSRTPVIYKITPDGTASIFYQDAAFATAAFGFNGIEYGNSHGGYLLVAFSAGNQVIKFPVSTPSDYNIVTLNATLAGPDGLLLSKNGKDLVVVNNAGGGNGKVISFTSQNKWESGTATNTFETGPVFPTTATSNGKNVYVLYAYLNRRTTGQSEYTIKLIPGTDKF